MRGISLRGSGAAGAGAAGSRPAGGVRASCTHGANRFSCVASHDENIFPFGAARSYLLLFSSPGARAAGQALPRPHRCHRSVLCPAPALGVPWLPGEEAFSAFTLRKQHRVQCF